MVDIDRGPDPLDSLAAFIANDVTRANRVGSLTDATHDRDAAMTANYLVDPDLADRAAHLMALGWAVEKAASRGEVEVLIADLRASAHATQHHQETT
jgi:class 3 adenylate cyclase